MATPSETAAAGGSLTSTPVPQVDTPLPGGAAAGQPAQDSAPNVGEYDPKIQLGRSGLKQYGGFIFEEFLNTLRGKNGAKAYREVVDNSPLVGGILRLIELTLRRVNKYIEPFAEETTAEDEERAERIDQALDDMSVSWPDLMAEITTMLPYGWAPMEIVWKTCRGWSDDGTTRSRFSDGLVMPRKIYLMAQDTLFRWNFDVDGGVKAMIQLPPPDYVMRTVPIEKMLLFRPHIEKGNPEGHSVLRSGYFSWVMIKRLIEFEAISGERHATGIPIAKIPGVNMLPGATAGQLATYAKFKKLVENLRIDDQMGAVIPSDLWPDTNEPMFKVEVIGQAGGGASSHFPFGEIITRHEVRLAISVLGDIVMMGHDKVGTEALAKEKKKQLAAVLCAWLDSIMAVFNRHLFPRIFAYNGWPMDRMCTMGHGGVADVDLDEFANAILHLSQAGMPLFPDRTLEDHIREEFGWPETTEDTPTGEPVDDPGADPAAADGDPNEDPGAPPPRRKPRSGANPASAAAARKRFLQAVAKYAGQPRSRRGAYHPRSGNVFSAVQLLRERAGVGGRESVNHGFHVASSAPYDRKGVTAAAVEAAPVERVRLRDLTATQPTVRRDSVRRFIENPGIVAPHQRNLSGVLEDRPVVVRNGDGKTYIEDGHHRLAARSLLGLEDVLARVLDLVPVAAEVAPPADQGTPRRVGSPAALAPAPGYDQTTTTVKTPPEARKEDQAPVTIFVNAPGANDPEKIGSAVADAIRKNPAPPQTPQQVVVNVQPTPVEITNVVEPTPVEVRNIVRPTPVTVENLVQAPVVNVEAKPGDTVVNVAAPNVTVEAPPAPDQRAVVQEVKRDAWGRIEAVVERPAKEDE